MTQPNNISIARYLQTWADSFALLLSRLSSSEWQIATSSSPLEGAVVGLRVTAATLPGYQSFTWSPKDLSKLLQLFVGEATVVGDELDEVQHETLEELGRQWCGLAASALKPNLGELSFDVAAATPAIATAEVQTLLASQRAASVAVQVGLDQGLADFFRQRPKNEEVATGQSAGGFGARIDELLREGNLDLLMDVELPVMLRFGTRQATLREVLDLATGAVLELDREVQDPVDLILNGKLIARGEVVVVDGNYGLRVTEVASAEQRLDSL